MTSALLRLGAGGLLALAGGGVGGVGTRLAGYSRGGVVGSRRWMALTESRLLKQHDISWNESTDTQIHPPRLWTGTPPSFSCSVTSLYLTISHLTLQVSSKPPCPAQICRSKAFFICSRLTWTVSARHRGSLMSPITFPRRLVASISTCLLSFGFL